MASSTPVQITLSINLNFTPNHVATVSAHFKTQSDETTIHSLYSIIMQYFLQWYLPMSLGQLSVKMNTF